MTSPPPKTNQHPPLSGLYAITPDCTDTPKLVEAVRAALEGGCRWLQYRDKISPPGERKKRAEALARLCRSFQAALIINDDLALAQHAEATGVHLGQTDGDPAHARQQLGPETIIGVTCHQSLALGEQATRMGADYIAFGAVFPSPTKPNAHTAPLSLFRQAQTQLALPACAIGGITLANASTLITAGASLLAVISDLFHDLNNPTAIQTRAFAYQKLFEELHEASE